MPASPVVQFLIVFGVLACLLSLWKGGVAERVGGMAVLTNNALTLIGANVFTDDVSYLAGLVLDGVTAIGFLVLTMMYGRLWLGAAMLIYAAQFALRSYYLVMQLEPDLLHARVNNLNFLAIILCILTGTGIAWRRRVVRRAADLAREAQS